jgi:hypothetical protein
MVRKLSFGRTRSLLSRSPALRKSNTAMSDRSEVSLISTAVWPSRGGRMLAKACGRTM